MSTVVARILQAKKDLPTIFDTYMAAAPYVPAIPPNGVCI